MKAFWILNFLPPPMAAALGLPPQASGSWVSALQAALADEPVQLVLCSFHAGVREPQRKELNGTIYWALPESGGKAALGKALAAEKPNLVQQFGTECAHAPWALELFAPEKVFVYIQGLATPCGQHMADGLPQRFLRRQPLKEWLACKTGGATVRQLRCRLLQSGEKEEQLLEKAHHIIGRTGWDKAYCSRINPAAAYHALPEIMRPDFYAGGWQQQACQPHRIFVSQGNLPLKGLHRVIEALPALLAAYPDTQLYVAGWPPPDKGPLLRPVLHWLAEYEGYLARLAKRLGVGQIIHYTGVLSAAEMRGQFLKCQTYLLPSSIENSPNSLGEAMLMGVPCAASRVGGIPSLLLHGTEGLLFEPDKPGALAQAVLQLWQNPETAAALGTAARQRALVAHDSNAAARQLMNIWQQTQKLQ